MSFELLLIFCLFFSFFAFLFYFLFKFGQQIQINVQQSKDIQEIKEKLSLGTQLQDHLKNGLEKTREVIEELKKLNEIKEKLREERERDFLERVKRIDEILVGTTAKGLSGEEILRETFKKLPPEMIEHNFQVRGKVVEFALVLPNGKRLPIDSKWPATKLILSLENEKEPEKKKEIIDEIEKEIIRRVKEVKQYIDPDLTWSQAIVAVPDSAYSVCKQAHLKANQENVILLPYSMVLPLLLYMYRLHLQYAISLDLENLQSHLMAITKNLDEMENILENKIYRGTTMISNAYSEYKQLIAKVKGSVEELKIKEKKEFETLK